MNNLSWVEINLSNLRSNIYNLKTLLKSNVKFMAVVKSNAYGHGIIEVAKAAVEAGASWLGVVNIEEALKIRKQFAIFNLKCSILVLGYVEPEDMVLAADNDISVPIVSLEHLQELQTVKFPLDKKLKVHLKIETGINRLGLQIEEIPEALEIIKKNNKIIIEGVYSHFASVEEQNIDYAKKQINNFHLASKQFDGVIKHISSSAAAILMPDAHFDMVRCGIAIYGLWPSQETKDSFLANKRTKEHKNIETNFLKPVLSYKTKIAQIKKVKVGEKIGYGCTYQVEKPMIIAVIPIGYYEGLDRGLSNPGGCGEVLVSGKRCPIIGRICMNMTVTDVTEVKSQNAKIKIGEEVVIIGKQGDEEITADEVAEKIGTINYEIVTRIPEHIKRIYK